MLRPGIDGPWIEQESHAVQDPCERNGISESQEISRNNRSNPGASVAVALAADNSKAVPFFGSSRQLPQAGDFAGQGRLLEQATFDRGINRLNPEFERAERSTLQNLTNQGFRPGTEGYGRELDRLGTAQADARENLALSSVQAGRTEQDRLVRLAAALQGQEHGQGLETGEDSGKARSLACSGRGLQTVDSDWMHEAKRLTSDYQGTALTSQSRLGCSDQGLA